jgi:hypothetical protein
VRGGPASETRELIFPLGASIDRVGSAALLVEDRAGVINGLLLAGLGLVEGGEGGSDGGHEGLGFLLLGAGVNRAAKCRRGGMGERV